MLTTSETSSKLTFKEKMRVGVHTFKTIRRNLLNKKFEPETRFLPKLVKAGDICLDIGAAYGRYALHLSRICGPDGRVHCFEPGAFSRAVLNNVVKFHGLNNLSIHKTALSDKDERVYLNIPLKEGKKMGSSLAYISTEPQENCIVEIIQTRTLSTTIVLEQIPRIDFIKCDTEGAEMKIFRGGLDVIDEQKPAILCEIDAEMSKRYAEQDEPGAERLLMGLGYEMFVLENGELKPVETVTESRNYFFIYPH